MLLIRCIAATLILLVPVLGSTYQLTTYQLPFGLSSPNSVTYGSIIAETNSAGAPYFVEAISAGGFDDSLIISGQSGTGVLTYDAHYMYLGQEGSGDVLGLFCLGIEVCGESSAGVEFIDNGYEIGVFTEHIPFTFGVPIDFACGVFVEAEDSPGFGGIPSVSEQIQVQDLTVSCNGPCTPNLTFTAASGTMYPFTNASFVESPEPATGLLAALALIGVLLYRQRRTRGTRGAATVQRPKLPQLRSCV